jgi:hypothetical protein
MIEHFLNHLLFKFFLIFRRYKIENIFFSSYSISNKIGNDDFS